MHAIVATQGIVLGKRTVGEANIAVALLTQELGLVRASARSARLERSKLRYGLEALTRGRFSLVRGKYEWKLTGAHGLSRPYLHASRAQASSAGRVARLLLRLIHGEEPVNELYTVVSNGFDAMAHASPETIDIVEGIVVLRILSLLGYVEPNTHIDLFLGTSGMPSALIEQARHARSRLMKAINEALGATGL